ncbi:hypothetical protein A9Q94_00300 [Rhodobacterales bacterium 56_14_T64]|nr:hypothetical protein A9Q94_00300 [Rhodobacterales bacterium 56_14_T64]
MFRVILIASTLVISACDPAIQHTSGRAYLAAGGIEDPDIAKFASYEPNLKFPARVGVVRLVYGRLSTMPNKERDLYLGDLPEAFGAVVHLGPLEAQMIGQYGYSRVDQKEIRQLAASRHLDYVMVLSFDPGKNSAEALFLDVRNGYPYASVDAKPPGRGKTNFWGNNLGNQSRLNSATYRLARHLKPELEAMVAGLASEVR